MVTDRSCSKYCIFFFFNDTATTEIYTLSLHDALPILPTALRAHQLACSRYFHSQLLIVASPSQENCFVVLHLLHLRKIRRRSEEHTSELQSRQYLVCRLLLEKKNKKLSTHCLLLIQTN